MQEGTTEYEYPVYKDLSGRVVFITGGGSGIGAYLTYAFSRQGARVAFVSLSEEGAHALVDATEDACGHRPLFIRCDIREINSLQDAIREVSGTLGPITTLINNAARDDRHDLQGMDVAAWDNAINTNLRPHFFSAKAAAEGMRAAGGGSIINLGSNSANLGLAGYPAYVTSKAAIVGLTRALARELGPSNIRVNALIPGWVMTERQTRLWATQEAVDACLAEQCLKRTLSGEDVAQAALFLASRSSAMMTGQSVIVDGGRAFV